MTMKEFDAKMHEEEKIKNYYLAESERIENEARAAYDADKGRWVKLKMEHRALVRNAYADLNDLLGGRRVYISIARKSSFFPFC